MTRPVTPSTACFDSSRCECHDSRPLSSLCRRRVADVGAGHPNGPSIVVDAVPDAAAGGDLVLPLLDHLAVHAARIERAPQRMLTVVALSWIVGDPLPGHARVGRCSRAHLLPTGDSFARCIPELPSSRRGWRRHPFLALRHDGQASGTRTSPPSATIVARRRRASRGSA